jgi:hypothetical protein
MWAIGLMMPSIRQLRSAGVESGADLPSSRIEVTIRTQAIA